MSREGAGAFAVELPAFTGPFRLLAELNLEQKVDVCDVSVAAVTDGFLDLREGRGAMGPRGSQRAPR